MKAREVRTGMAIRVKSQPWVVQKIEESQGSSSVESIFTLTLKNLDDDELDTSTCKADDEIDLIKLSTKKATLDLLGRDVYSFRDIDCETPYGLFAENMPRAVPFIEDAMTDLCDVTFYNEKAVSVELPKVVSRQITHTEKASSNSSHGTAMKPARLRSGNEVQVPDEIKTGEYIDIDTRDGSYVGRSNERRDSGSA